MSSGVPFAYWQVPGEAGLIKDISESLSWHGRQEVGAISNMFSHRFNEVVRSSPITSYTVDGRNDGSFKKWLVKCGFKIGAVFDGNKAYVEVPTAGKSKAADHGQNGTRGKGTKGDSKQSSWKSSDWAWQDDSWKYSEDYAAWDPAWSGEQDAWTDHAKRSSSVEQPSGGIGDDRIVDTVRRDIKRVLGVSSVDDIRGCFIHCINLQDNVFSGYGITLLVDWLLENRIRTDEFRLFKNAGIDKQAAVALARLYSADARLPPREIHLTHCSIDSQGAAELLIAIASRWVDASSKNHKPAKAAYVRLDHNPLNVNAVEKRLTSAGFGFRKGYDPMSRHRGLLEIHQLGSDVALVMIPQLQLTSSPTQESNGLKYAKHIEEEVVEPSSPAKGSGKGAHGAQHNGNVWVPVKSTEVSEDRDEDVNSKASSSSANVDGKALSNSTNVVKEQNSDEPPWEPSVESRKPEGNEELARDCLGQVIALGCRVAYHDDNDWQGCVAECDQRNILFVDWASGPRAGQRTRAGGKFLRVMVAHIRDCQGQVLTVGCRVQYHDDDTWQGWVVNFDGKHTFAVDWISGDKSGRRTHAAARFLKVVEESGCCPETSEPTSDGEAMSMQSEDVVFGQPIAKGDSSNGEATETSIDDDR